MTATKFNNLRARCTHEHVIHDRKGVPRCVRCGRRVDASIAKGGPP